MNIIKMLQDIRNLKVEEQKTKVEIETLKSDIDKLRKQPAI